MCCLTSIINDLQAKELKENQRTNYKLANRAYYMRRHTLKAFDFSSEYSIAARNFNLIKYDIYMAFRGENYAIRIEYSIALYVCYMV